MLAGGERGRSIAKVAKVAKQAKSGGRATLREIPFAPEVRLCGL
jgi:hypothetical protein